MATKNKGELSEFYSFIYILGKGFVQLVDGNLVPNGDKLNFFALYRKDETSEFDGKTYESMNEYNLAKFDDSVEVKSKRGTHIIPKQLLKDHADALLKLIQSDAEVQDDDPELVQLKKWLDSEFLSAKSQDKSDFKGDVSSGQIPGVHRLGFSVKSQLGSNSTLVNANKAASAFQYRIVRNGKPLTSVEISTIQTWPDEDQKLIKRLLDEGYELVCTGTKGEALRYNLRLMDSCGPEIIGALLLERYSCKRLSTPLLGVIESLAQDSHASRYPWLANLGESEAERKAVLSYKLKNILLGFTTGATVSTKWSGLDDANGGFLVVTKDGQVVCLELFTRNAIGEYLIKNTCFDNPSKKRHKYGTLYTLNNGEQEELYIDFQLQVRFN